ncbi:MAG: enoyl-CoA hydratase-related protein [Pseudomonadota bacterium]
MSVLLSHQDGAVLTLTLNRPDVHNAFNAELIAALHGAFSEVPADVRAIILRGEGKSFCAGADLTWMKEASGYAREENVADAQRLSAMLNAIYQCPVPVIADVHGAAYGGGVGLTACADIAIAKTGTKFMLSEVRLGLTPATISPFVLRAMGERVAMRYFVSAEAFGPDLALRCGLLQGIDEDVDGVAKAIAANGPEAVQAAKALVRDFAGMPVDDALRDETAERIAARRASEEGREGIAAFLEKRSPAWREA